jgi:outer membrane lipoprotein LolB
MVVVLAATSCTTPPRRQAVANPEEFHARRAETLSGLHDWRLTGRLAINDGSDGGSGNLNWHNSGETHEMSFRGALGRGAWRLTAGTEGAWLGMADGSEFWSPTIESLVADHVGWAVPVDALAWWVRALAAPGSAASVDFDEFGYPLIIEQDGWQIEFGAYRSAGAAVMPGKISAIRDSYRVRLVVKEWELSSGRAD